MVLAAGPTHDNPGVPRAADVAINGRPYVVDTSEGAGFAMRSVPIRRPQADTSDGQGGSSLTKEGLWSRTVEGFEGGSGLFFEREGVTNRLRKIEGGHVTRSQRLVCESPVDTSLMADTGSPSFGSNHPNEVVSSARVLDSGLTPNIWYVYSPGDSGIDIDYFDPDGVFTNLTVTLGGLVGDADGLCAMGGWLFALQNSVIKRCGYIGIDGSFDAGMTIQTEGPTAWPSNDTAQMFGVSGKVLVTAPHDQVPALYSYDWENHSAGGTSTLDQVDTFRPNDDIVGVVETGRSVYLGLRRIEGTSEIYRYTVNPNSGAISVDRRAFVFPEGEVLTAIAGTGAGLVCGFRNGFRFLAEDGGGNLTAGARVELPFVNKFSVAGDRVAFITSDVFIPTTTVNGGWVGWMDLQVIDDDLVPAWWLSNDLTSLLSFDSDAYYARDLQVYAGADHDSLLEAPDVVVSTVLARFSRDSSDTAAEFWTPWYDFGTQNPKVLHGVRVRAEAASVNTTVDVYYGTELDDTWTLIGSQTLTGGSGYNELDFQMSAGVDFHDVSIRVNVTGTSQTDRASITGIDTFAYPEPERIEEIILPIQLSDRVQRPHGGNDLILDPSTEYDNLTAVVADAGPANVFFNGREFDALAEDYEWVPAHRKNNSTDAWHGLFRLRLKRFL